MQRRISKCVALPFDRRRLRRQSPLSTRIKAMTNIEVPESYTDHDGGELAAVNVRVVATWPAPTFVENLAIDSAGAIFVSLCSHNRVDRYDPATGATAPFAALPAPPMGLAFDAGGALWATGGTMRKGPGY